MTWPQNGWTVWMLLESLLLRVLDHSKWLPSPSSRDDRSSAKLFQQVRVVSVVVPGAFVLLYLSSWGLGYHLSECYLHSDRGHKMMAVAVIEDSLHSIEVGAESMVVSRRREMVRFAVIDAVVVVAAVVIVANISLQNCRGLSLLMCLFRRWNEGFVWFPVGIWAVLWRLLCRVLHWRESLRST